MSSETDNFITLDDISEIQDVVNGDFIFTISKGIIYKLDFQNFIISKDNIDFYTTIESLSAQVVTNTQSLCAINGYLNDNKSNIANAINCRAQVHELSSTWTSVYTTCNMLSTTTWLPMPTEEDPFESGAMVYYDGAAGDWKPIQPGHVNSALKIGDAGIPIFGIPSANVSGFMQILNNTTEFTTTSRTFTQTISLPSITDVYNYVQINGSAYLKNPVPRIGSGNNSRYTTASIVNQTITYKINDVLISSAAGIGILPGGNKNDQKPIDIKVIITGTVILARDELAYGNNFNIVYSYMVTGSPETPS